MAIRSLQRARASVHLVGLAVDAHAAGIRALITMEYFQSRSRRTKSRRWPSRLALAAASPGTDRCTLASAAARRPPAGRRRVLVDAPASMNALLLTCR